MYASSLSLRFDESLIHCLQFHTIFDEADAEADQDDDEFDEPILEEDEEAEAENSHIAIPTE
jgi:hypothetical protein